MNEKQLLNTLPTIKKRTHSFRAQISSDELNQTQEETLNDILNLYAISNSITGELLSAIKIANIENVYAERKLEEMTKKIKELELKEINRNLSLDELHTITVFPHEHTYPLVSNADVGSITDDIVPESLECISKVHLYNDSMEEYLVPQSLKTYLGPDDFQIGEHIASIEDSDILAAFEPSDSVFIRTVTTDASIEQIENELVIGLPEDIITTRLANELVLIPFPMGFVDIMDVSYRSNGTWKQIPGFICHDGCELIEEKDAFGNKYSVYEVQDAPALRFTFPDLAISQLKIKFRQRHYEYNEETNQRIWMYGIRQIAVNYKTYQKDPNIFYETFEFPENEHNVQVYGSKLNYNNQIGNVPFDVSMEYYSLDESGDLHRISESCPFALSGNHLVIKYNISGAGIIPNVSSCSVSYKLT